MGGFDQFMRVVAEREREREREEMTRYEVNGCFFCVKYMWENDTWRAVRERERERVLLFVDVGGRVLGWKRKKEKD